MNVYHGSYTEVQDPQIIKGKFHKDFGTGFYCTVIREQAEKWAKRNKNSIVNIYSVNMRILEGLNVKNFESMTDEWLDFIIDCRSGKRHEYDVVIGAMANDQIYSCVEDYIAGNITREMFWALAKFKYPTHQIAFCTNESLRCLQFIRSSNLNDEVNKR